MLRRYPKNMPNKFKCPHCEEEIEKLKVTYEHGSWKTQILSWLPILLVAIYLISTLNIFRSEEITDLDVSVNSVTLSADSANTIITATVTNDGKETWNGVCIDAEVYDSAGKFVKEYVYRLSADIYPGATENVMIEPRFLLSAGEEVKLKISQGRVDPF